MQCPPVRFWEPAPHPDVIMASIKLFQCKEQVSSSRNIQWAGEATENCDRCWCNQLEWNHGYRTWRAEISMFTNWYRLWICDWFLRKYWWACILWVIMDDSFYFKALKTGNKRWIWFQKYGFKTPSDQKDRSNVAITLLEENSRHVTRQVKSYFTTFFHQVLQENFEMTSNDL